MQRARRGIFLRRAFFLLIFSVRMPPFCGGWRRCYKQIFLLYFVKTARPPPVGSEDRGPRTGGQLMTKDGTTKIIELQNKGMGYKRISALTGLPVNTVKSYCRRHPACGFGACQRCGAAVKQTLHKRVKKFCSDACRMAWWKAHPEQVKRKVYQLTCAWCGKPFDSIGDDSRHYCSRACYADARRKECRE